MTRLRSCESCRRHVFVTETRCPFCAAPLGPLALGPVPQLKPGLSRAQRFAITAAVAGQTWLVGCGNSLDPRPQPGDAAGGGTGQNVQPVYGAPVTPGIGGSGGAGQSAGSGGVQAVPVYGAPIAGTGGTAAAGSSGSSPDAGAAGSGANDEDAGTPDAAAGSGGQHVQPVYGAPIPLYGAPIPEDK